MRRLVLSLLIGLLIGAAIGLTLGWIVLPAATVEGDLRSLSARYKDDYTVMVAAGFIVDRDVAAAVDRLAPLGMANVFTYVRDVTERYISQAGKGREADIRNLVELSCALGYCSPLMEGFRLPTPIPSPTPGS